MPGPGPTRCHLSQSVICHGQSSAMLSSATGSRYVMSQFRLSRSVICHVIWQNLSSRSATVCHLSRSVSCHGLSPATICHVLSSVSVCRLSRSVVCHGLSSVSDCHLSRSVFCQSVIRHGLSYVTDCHLSRRVICLGLSSATTCHLSRPVICHGRRPPLPRRRYRHHRSPWTVDADDPGVATDGPAAETLIYRPALAFDTSRTVCYARFSARTAAVVVRYRAVGYAACAMWVGVLFPPRR